MITIRRTFLFSQPGKWAIEHDASCVTFDQLMGEVTDPSVPVEVVAHFETKACMDAFSGKLVAFNEYGRRCAEFPLTYINFCDKTASVAISAIDGDYVISDNTPDVVSRTWKVDITLFQYVIGDSHSQTIRLRPLQPIASAQLKLSQVFADGCTNEDEFFLQGATLFQVEATSAVLVEVPEVKVEGCEGCQQGATFLTVTGGPITSIDVTGLPSGACYQFFPDENKILWAAPPGVAGTYNVTIKAWNGSGQMAMTTTTVTVIDCRQANAVTYQPTVVKVMCGTLDDSGRVDSHITDLVFGDVDWDTFAVVSKPSWLNVVVTPSAILFEPVTPPSGTTYDEVVWSIEDTQGQVWQFSTPVKSVVSGALTYPGTIEICPVCSELTEPIDLRSGITPLPPNNDMVFTGDPDVVAVQQGDKWSFYVRPDNVSLNPIVYYQAYRPDGCLETAQGGMVLHPVCVGVPRGTKDLTCEANKQLNLLDLVTLTVYHPFQSYTFQEVTTGYTSQGGTISASGDVDFTNISPGTYVFRITAQRTDYPCSPPATHSVDVEVRIDEVAPFPYDTKDNPLVIIWPTTTYSSPVINTAGLCRQYLPATDSGVTLPSGWSAASDMWAKFTKGAVNKIVKVRSAGLSDPAQGLQVAIYDQALTVVTQATGTDTVSFDTSTLGLTTDDTYLIRVAPLTPGNLKIEIL